MSHHLCPWVVLASLIPTLLTAYVCEDRLFQSDSSGYINSPGFPDPFPKGPYTCSYTFENTGNGTVWLRFHDFFTQGQINSEFRCSESISLYDGDRFIQKYCRKIFTTYKSISSTVKIEFRVDNGINKYRALGFRFFYKFVQERRQEKEDFHSKGYIDLFKDPLGTINQPIGNLVGHYTFVWVIRAMHLHKSTVLLTHFPNGDSYKNTEDDTILVVRDGLHSQSPIVYTWDGKSTFGQINSNSTGLYIYLQVNASTPLLFTALYTSVKSGQDCPPGYRACADDRCVGYTAICQDERFCGNNEVITGINCGNVNQVYCRSHQDCKNGGHCFGRGSYCFCSPGHSGDYCEYDTVECIPGCANGGTCKSGRCICPETYSGYNCDFAVIYTKDYSWIGFSVGGLVYVFLAAALVMIIAIKLRGTFRRSRNSRNDIGTAENGDEVEMAPLRSDEQSQETNENRTMGNIDEYSE